MNTDIYKKLLFSTKISSNAAEEENNRLEIPLYEEVTRILPHSLYKYRNCTKNNFNALRHNKIFFNVPNNFNDPYDCLTYISKRKLFSLLKNSFSSKSEIDIAKKIRNSKNIEIKDLRSNVSFVKNFFYSIKEWSDEEFNSFIEKIEKINPEISKLEEVAPKLIKIAVDFFNSYLLNKINISCFSENNSKKK